MEKHRFAVIGIKGVGATHIKAIQSLPNAELVALVDLDEAAVKARAAELGVRAFTDYEATLNLPEVEIVNQAPHELDQFTWMVGLPKQLKAWTTTQMHAIPVEDMADAILLFENGAVAHLHANTLDVPSYSQLGFFGRRAALVFDAGGLRRSRLAQPLDEFIRTCPEAWGKLESSWEPVTVPPQEGPHGHAGIAADMIAA